MKTRMFSLTATCLCLAAVATLCNGAPAPKMLSLKERATLRSGGVSWIAFSPDGKMLASAGHDKTIKLWNVAKGEEIVSLSGPAAAVNSLAFSPDGKFLVSNSADHSLRLWDVANRKSIAVLAERWGETKDLLFSPDGKMLVCGRYRIDFWDVHTKKHSKQVKLPLEGRDVLFPETSLAYNVNGKLLAVVWPRYTRTAEVWDVVAGKSLRTLEYPEKGDFRSRVAFSRDCKVLASAWEGLCLWDVTTGKRIGSYEHPKQITCLTFRPDGTVLATGWSQREGDEARRGIISLLDVGSGKELAALKGHTQPIECVVFSPDGKILASASVDHTIKLWDVRGVKAPKKKE